MHGANVKLYPGLLENFLCPLWEGNIKMDDEGIGWDDMD
jgi:hypothetical protein